MSNKTEMITKLTQEQIDAQPRYVDKWVKIGLDTSPCDFEQACHWVDEVYKVADQKPPTFHIGPVNSPYEGAVAELVLQKYNTEQIEFDSPEHLNELVLKEVDEIVKSGVKPKNLPSINNQIYGSGEYWLSYYDYFQEECGLDLKEVTPLIELAKVCGWWTPFNDVAILQHKFEEVHRDSENRLHNENGPAVKYRGESEVSNVYAVHGVRVPKSVIERNYSAQDIDDETNAEVRRVMIDLYGTENYIRDTNAEVVHTDDFGTLYRKNLDGDESIMMIKVVNSTPEPDGSYKDYWIRVDPNAYGGLKTARAAVASTWRNSDGSMVFEHPEDYDCAIET